MVSATMQNNDDEIDQEVISCTSSTPNEDNNYYQATKTPESERKLAGTLGYPQTWHVVRIVPHPCTNNSNNNSCMDTIYTSSPDSGCDVYYNHNSALKAAMNWIPGESTGYEQKGGQMLPRQQLFEKGDLVQVLYSEDDKWYDATVEKVKEYLNDIRYTVHYTDEDATQSNVSEELLRKAPPKATKKRKYQKKTKKAPPPIETKKKVNKKKQTKITTKKPPPPKKKKKEPPKKKKQKIVVEDNSSSSSNEDEDDSSSSEHNEKSDKMVKYLSQFSLQEIQKRIKYAIGLGLPEGWVAASLSNSRFDIVNPEGVRFKTKKSAFESLQPQNEDDVLSSNEEEEEEEEPSEDSSSSDHDTDTEQEEEEEMEQTDDDDDTVDSKPPPSKRKKKPTPKKKKQTPKKSTTPKHKKLIPPPPQIEEGDPPWRTTGHEYIGRKLIYKHTPSSSSKTMTQHGIVKGWIDSTDVDSNGDAAFLSEKSGDPAMLFHVRFDFSSNNKKKGTGKKWKGSDDLLFVDMEEYELLDCLVKKKNDEDDDESESEEDSEEDDKEEVNW